MRISVKVAFITVLMVCLISPAFYAEGRNSKPESGVVQAAEKPIPEKSKVEKKSPSLDHNKPLEGETLIVFDMIPEHGVSKGVANLLTEVVLDQAAKLKKYNVIGQKDLDKMLFWETNKTLKGCTESSCLVQIAGAMGASYYIEGSIGIVGGQMVITLKFMDALRAVVLARTTRTINNDESILVRNMREMTLKILGVEVGVEKGPLWMRVAGFTGVGLGVASFGGAIYFKLQSDNLFDRLKAGKESDPKSAVDKGKGYDRLTTIGIISGSVLTAAGAALLYFGYLHDWGGIAVLELKEGGVLIGYGGRY
jgi:TolB-like protein